MRKLSPPQWVIAAIFTLALGAASLVLTNNSPINKDAAQNLQMAIDVSHYGIMSMDDSPPYNRSMYREPLPVATTAVVVGIVDHILGKTDSEQYFSGKRARYVKYQNTLWLILLWVAVFTATRWFTGSFWLSLVAGLLAVKPFLDSVVAEGVNNLYTELPGAVLMTFASFALTVAVARARMWLMVTAGLSFGVLTLTKAATLYIFVGLVVVLLFSYVRGRAQVGRGRRCLHIIVMTGAFVIVIAPWIVRNYAAFGRPQISDRGGLVLYTRALLNQVTPVEYRGTFYVWARPILQPYVGSLLGFTPQDLEPGGRLERLGGGPDTAIYDRDRAAELAGRPEDTISLYRRARAERVRLEQELERERDPNPSVTADGMLAREGMQIIKGDVWRDLAMAVPLLWRGALLIFPVLAIALGYSLWAKRYTLALFVLPSFATLSFYALATHFEPRPARVAHATAVVAGVIMLRALWLWRFHGRQMTAASFSKDDEVGKGEVPNKGGPN